MNNKRNRIYPVIDTISHKAPDYADDLEWDEALLGIVNRMLSVPVNELDVLCEAARLLIVRRNGTACNDAFLAAEIDLASAFICDEELLSIHVLTSRYARSEL